MNEGYSVDAVEMALDEILPIESTYADVEEQLTRSDVYVTGGADSLIQVVDSRGPGFELMIELLKKSLIYRLDGVDAVVKGNTISLMRSESLTDHSLD